MSSNAERAKRLQKVLLDSITSAFGPIIEFVEMTEAQQAERIEVLSLELAKIKNGSRVQELEKQKDGAYAERNKYVAAMCAMAMELGYPAVLGRHGPLDASWDSDWMNVVFILLPSGQVSWHIHDSELEMFSWLPRSTVVWDGHSTELKYERLATLVPRRVDGKASTEPA